MTRGRIAVLLFCSGMCALIYQVAWLRELRLVFGASTPANAAVLAVFMGGLGYGSWRLSKRADEVDSPLLLYGNLEAGIALTAALSPLLLDLVRWIYVQAGGTTSMGLGLGTGARLLLAAVVLFPPTFLMGGTLPAAARAATSHKDVARGSTALLYGANTIGAVVGAATTNFLLLEVFGTRLTLWLGTLLNALVAVVARVMSRRMEKVDLAAEAEAEEEDAVESPAGSTKAPRAFVLAAALAVGLAFLLMELVWYRMLGPLLGGSTYTFGLILAVALLGIGAGGLLYPVAGGGAPSLGRFAASCALEAAFIAIPFAFGDRIAIAALMLRDFGVVGLWGHVLAWSAVCGVVVLPASLVAGYQFPMLVALLGRGRAGLGRDVGMAYLFNTAGAIVGSLAGGFLVIPYLTAPGTWRAVVLLLVVVAAAALAIVPSRRMSASRMLAASAGVLAAMCVVLPDGPTAAWRHSPIGAGRSDEVLSGATRNTLIAWRRDMRRAISWEREGLEMSIGLHTLDDTAFIINGKSDGAAVADAGTQIGSGLIAAMRRPKATRAFVIGLGTGSTAGWLGAIPEMEVVDVVELEPWVVEVARLCAAVNHDCLDNPKVHNVVADGREVLLTTPHAYDIIVSEPSNPYRAGIASFFTKDFYQAVHARLRPGGVFVQWLQAYDIDATAIRMVYSTLHSVFGEVESWRTAGGDLLLLSSDGSEPIDAVSARARLAQEPFASGFRNAWRATTLEDLLARFVAAPGFGRAMADSGGEGAINSDDRNQLEFSIARSLGRDKNFSIDRLRGVASLRGEGRPQVVGEVDWRGVIDSRIGLGVVTPSIGRPLEEAGADPEQRRRRSALLAWTNGRHDVARELWAQQPAAPRSLIERTVMADALADGGDEAALPLIESIARERPIDADLIRARLALTTSDVETATAALERAFLALRSDPWVDPFLLRSSFAMAASLALEVPRVADRLERALAESFAVHRGDDQRRAHRFDIAMTLPDPARCAAAMLAFEPHTPWEPRFLSRRVECYALARHPLLAVAQADLEAFAENTGIDVQAMVSPR
jgi:spermidine synthase